MIRQHKKVTINATLFQTTSVSVKMDANGGELSTNYYMNYSPIANLKKFKDLSLKMADEKEEEYVSINADTRHADMGHILYNSFGVRLNKNDALMMTGLRFFLKCKDLELLKEKYPHTLDALAGFLVMMDYMRGKATVKDLRKLTTVVHRLNMGETTKSEKHRGKRNSFKLGPSIVWDLIERIWYTALDVKEGHTCDAESVYQILSDNARKWRGPNWLDLQRFEKAAEYRVEGLLEWDLFSVTLRDGYVTALCYLPDPGHWRRIDYRPRHPTPPIPIPQRETVIMAHLHRH